MNQERDFFGQAPQQRVIPDPPHAAFPHQFDHIPNSNQQTEDLRSLASRYWYHPNSEVGGVSVEKNNTTGRDKVMIILDV
jgi:hypothetical protein